MGKDGKKGLGMGLGALFGEEYPTAQPERAECRNTPATSTC